MRTILLISLFVIFGIASVGTSYAVVTLSSTDDVTIPTTKKYMFDGGIGSTYLSESVTNNLDLYVGGVNVLGATPSGLAISPNQKFYLDGGGAFGSNYITESSSVVTISAGGSGGLIVTPTGAGIPLQKKLILDSGAGSYISESSLNNLDLYVGGVNVLGATPSGLAISPNQKFYLDGGGAFGSNYITESSTNVVTIGSGGLPIITAKPTRVGIDNTSPQESLDVTGNIRLSGNIVSPNDICIGSC